MYGWILKGKKLDKDVVPNFSIYNLMHDGIHSMAGKQEFDPVRDVKDAFVFS